MKWVAIFNSDSSRGFAKDSGEELECSTPIRGLNLDLFEMQMIEKYLTLINTEFVY